jgi:hypothetical protein
LTLAIRSSRCAGASRDRFQTLRERSMPTGLTVEHSDPKSIAIDMENGIATIRDLADVIAFLAVAPHGDEEVSLI